MDKIVGVYKIYNIVNNKCYIGSSININNRLIRHKCDLRAGIHHSIKLQRSWKKYGETNFRFEILEECVKEKKILLALEQKYIDSLHPELNSSLVAGNCMGVKASDEAKRKMSLAKLGKSRKHIFTEEVRENMSNAQKGKILSLETIEKISKSKKGISPSRGHLEKLHSAARIWSQSEEGKKSVSECHKGRKMCDETIKKKSIPVTQYDMEMNKIRDWGSPTFAQRELGISNKSINDCCRGRKKSAGGFKWTQIQ